MGVRVRTYLWKDRRGWSYRHRYETHLTQNGMAARTNDRFVAPSGDVVNYKTRLGVEMTKTCVGQTEFTPLAADGTRVTAVHNHSLDGGG